MTTPSDFEVEWVDRGREPQVAPNPAYPTGIDIDLSQGAKVTCQSALPYPAKRIGFYHVKCNVCGLTAVVTTAGRIDDPRSLTMACKL